MGQRENAASKKAHLSHGVELFEYYMSRNLRKRNKIYDFLGEGYIESNSLKDYRLIEEELKKEAKYLFEKSKKKALLT